jgi:membrane protein insertase Oxa1/YidC/SpoIIIJ
VETARLYKQAGINPLAGCLPTLATIPVFIGLYRALTRAADEGLLTSGFFWIPSLAGPSSIAARQSVSSRQPQVSLALVRLCAAGGYFWEQTCFALSPRQQQLCAHCSGWYQQLHS